MKSPLCIAASFALSVPVLHAQTVDYTNFILQKQSSGVVYNMPVAPSGEDLSPLAINPGGADFELWTVNSTTGADYLLDSRYVSAYTPVCEIIVRSGDPYEVVPRTRADQPFHVDITINGLVDPNDVPNAPEPSKKLKLLHHVQSYGATGTGFGLDRSQATLLSQSYLEVNGLTTWTFEINSVPGANRAKIRGEERFSAFSIEDYQAPESQLASQFIQIWPVADGGLAGISPNQDIRFKLPPLTVTLNDLYPNSHTYAQVYMGAPQLGVTGTIVPGSSILISETVPQNRTLSVTDYDAVFVEDGQWTMELLTATPFGIDRLDYVTFSVDRTLEMNGSVTTID